MSDTYIKIVKSAYNLFATHGFDRTTLNMIAAEVGITKPSMYYYFRSKEALFDVVFKIILGEIQFEKAYPLENLNTDQIQSELIRTGCLHIVNQEKDRFYLPIMREFSTYTARNPRFQKEFAEIIAGYVSGFERLLGKCRDAGLLDADSDIRARAELLATVVNGITMGMQSGMKLDYKKIWTQAVEKSFEFSQ